MFILLIILNDKKIQNKQTFESFSDGYTAARSASFVMQGIFTRNENIGLIQHTDTYADIFNEGAVILVKESEIHKYELKLV